jgi:hypothetical protein
MRPYGTVGLTDGSPGFAHAEYYRSLRSEPPLHPRTLANSGLMSPVGSEVAAYKLHTPVGLITRGWGSGGPHPPEELDTRQCRVNLAPLPGGVVNSA